MIASLWAVDDVSTAQFMQGNAALGLQQASKISGPGRIRTYDQGIHLSPTFPPGVDYLFTRA